MPSTMQWLDTNSTDAQSDDLPFVFSNPESPYDTYASWQTLANPVTGYLRYISYDLSTTPYPTAKLGTFSISIPRSNADNSSNCGVNGTTGCIPARFNFGFATLPGGTCASGSEGIIVTWATIPSGSGVQCLNRNSGYGSTGNPGMDQGLISWNVAVYDTACVNSGGTSGCWLSGNNSKCQQGNCTTGGSDGRGCSNGACAVAFTSSAHFDLCAGQNSQVGACGCSGSCTCPWYTNSPDPKIAVDPNPAAGADVVWISHTNQAQTLGQIFGRVDHAPYNCNPNNNPPFWHPFNFSPYPYQWTQPGNGDVFEPAVAMYRNFVNGVKTQHVGAYWYGANNAKTQTSQIEVDGGFVDAGVQSPLQHLSTANYPLVPANETWWTTTNPPYQSEYENMATSWHPANTNSGISFLSLWSQDNRANLLAPAWNGGFETVNWMGWTHSGAATSLVNSSLTCNSGQWCALLGSTSPTNGDSTITQQFTAPATGQGQNVSFYYKMYCGENSTYYDWLTANVTPQGGLPQYFFPYDSFCNHGAGGNCVCDKAKNGIWQRSPTIAIPACTPSTAPCKYTITITNADDNYPGDSSYTYIDDVVFGGPTSGGTTIVANLSQ